MAPADAIFLRVLSGVVGFTLFALSEGLEAMADIGRGIRLTLGDELMELSSCGCCAVATTGVEGVEEGFVDCCPSFVDSAEAVLSMLVLFLDRTR